MKFIKLYENFIGNDDFLIEKDWENFVPENVNLKKDGKKAKYSLRDSLKNLNQISLIYNLEEADTERFPNTLTIVISLKMKNDPETPMVNNSFEATLEITLGTLYVMGIIINKKGKHEFIERKANIDDSASKKIAKLINYASGKELKISSIK